MIAVYSPQPTPRIEFAAKLLFGIVLGTKCEVFKDADSFRKSDAFKVNYSDEEVPADLHWQPHAILLGMGVEPIEIKMHTWQDLPAFLGQDDPNCSFDMMAAAFFLATRYEEYLPHEPDRHGRYLAALSTARQHNFLERPLINEWAKKLRWHILKVKPDVRFKDRNFEAEATFDIDVAWAYRHKGLFRTTAAFVWDLVNLQFRRFGKRWEVVFGNMTDPYDTYFYIRKMCDFYHIDARYFFLLGDYSNFDRNSNPQLPAMQDLIRTCTAHGAVGIHPSYGSHQSTQQLQKEIGRLAGILGENVNESRQHYLKMTLPETYRTLHAAGITSDYTMGYAEQVGFRASLCTPFPFFDLLENRETDLWLHPFAYMDGTLNQYMKLDPETAKSKVEDLVEAVRSVEGDFSCLWHNSSLCNEGEWKGWRSVFEHTLKCCESGSGA